MQRHEKFAQSVHTVSCKITCESVSGKGGLIMYRAKISPNLKKIQHHPNGPGELQIHA